MGNGVPVVHQATDDALVRYFLLLLRVNISMIRTLALTVRSSGRMLEIFQLRYIVIFTIKEAFKPSKRD